MNLLSRLVVASFLVGSIAVANASVTLNVGSLPYVKDREGYGQARSGVGHRFEKHQYARTFIWIQPDGSVRVNTRFENGKRLDGDHFYCRIEFLDESKARIGVIRQNKGLNPMKKGWVRSKGSMTASEAASIRHVRVTYGHFNAVDDGKFWNTVVTAAEAAGVPYVGDIAMVMRVTKK